MATLCQQDDLFTAGCGWTITGWRTVTLSKKVLDFEQSVSCKRLILNRGMTFGYDIEIVSASVVSCDFDRTVRSVT